MWYLGVRTPTLQPGVETVGIRNSHVRERRDSPPEARTEDLSRILSGVTNAVEQACYANSTMFIDKHFYHLKPTADGTVITSLRNGAFPFLYDPLSNITQILKNIGSDVNRYAWPIRHLKAVGNTTLRTHLDSSRHTNVKKLSQLKLFLDFYNVVETKPYSSLFHQLINNFDSTIAKIETLISLLSSIIEEGDLLDLDEDDPSPTSSVPDAMITNADIVDLESEGDEATESNIIDLEDEGGVETEGDDGPGSPQSQSGSSTPTPSHPGTRAPTPGYTESYWSETSTVRPPRPSPPSPYRRTPSPKLFDYPSQSPPPTLPTTGFGYDPLPQFPRTPSPPPDPRIPSWKNYMSTKHRIEDLSVSEPDLAVFGQALQLARDALRQAQIVQRMCMRLEGLYWPVKELYSKWKKVYEKADPELVEQVWEQLERDKEAEEKKKRQLGMSKELGLETGRASGGRKRRLETVVEEEGDEDEEMTMLGEEMEVEEELGVEGGDEVEVDDEKAELLYALDQIAAMEAREASQPANVTAAAARLDLDE